MQAVSRSAHLRSARSFARIAVATAGVLVLACLAALGLAAGARAAMFEWEAVAVSGLNPGSIATDSAGRVYVPQRGAGVVYVYDSARNGNRPLGAIGAGRLQDPAAVSVDNRMTIYVADAARDVVVTFGSITTGAEYRGTDGGTGSALGQMHGVVSLATDPEPRLYAAESLNSRVQAFDPARGTLGTLFAFGTTDPAPWGPPAGVAVDPDGRFFVSGSGVGNGVRMFDSRGVFAANAVAPGAGPGQVDRAEGLDVDPAGRILVADSGNDRVALFDKETGGFAALGSFGGSGSGAGQFEDPASLARAPGALLYVADAGNGRIVRLRYDDEDHDGAIDALDNCRGLANATQLDHDGDGSGNDCDVDDDGDGLPDASDPCPTTNPLVDVNRDGCAEPIVSALAPKRGTSFKSGRGPSRISGRVKADSVGVAGVSVAVLRRANGRCAWWSSRRKAFAMGSCTRPRWVTASGDERWQLRVRRRAFKRGNYSAYVRAVQRVTGAVASSTAPSSRFSVR